MATDTLEAPDVEVTPDPVVDPAAPVETPAEPTETPETPERPRGPDGKFLPKDTPQAPAPESGAPVLPAEFKLVLPKDSPLPAATVERTAAIARELGLSNAAAQTVLESVNAEAAALVKAQNDAWEPGKGAEWLRRDTEWKAEALKDAEIGGSPDKLKVATEKAQQVLGKFFPPTITEFLQASGLGSHPDVIKGLAKIGRGMSEGTLILGAPADTSGPKTLAQRMYPNGGEGPPKKTD